MVYYRTLSAAYIKHDLKCEFWTHSIDAHLLQAVVCWCMVFGSDGSNEIKWKRLADNNSKEIEDSFRAGLPEYVGISWKQWELYWEQMTDFRNKFAAHRELQYDEKVPYIETALKVAYYYDDWVRTVIYPSVFEEPSLIDSANRLMQSVTPLVEELICHTKIQG